MEKENGSHFKSDKPTLRKRAGRGDNALSPKPQTRIHQVSELPGRCAGLRTRSGWGGRRTSSASRRAADEKFVSLYSILTKNRFLIMLKFCKPTLRKRAGRGNDQGYCIPDRVGVGTGHHLSAGGRRRLEGGQAHAQLSRVSRLIYIDR